MLQYWRVGLLALAMMVVGAFQLYGVWSNAGYQPQQPIAFSHVVHAGVMKMECLYCHFTAEKGAHAGVPPVEVCMGCHSIVATDSPEIQKLAEYYNNNEPVPWVRIHRLPDHSYFNHRWHLEAGVACQTCHGPIQNMPVVQQWTKLEMGACMECHRNEDYTENIHHSPTYASTPPAWDEMPDTLAAMGGGSHMYVDEEDMSSVYRTLEKYYTPGLRSEAEAAEVVRNLAAYKQNLYYHGWGAQLRDMNASVECNICHH